MPLDYTTLKQEIHSTKYSKLIGYIVAYFPTGRHFFQSKIKSLDFVKFCNEMRQNVQMPRARKVATGTTNISELHRVTRG